MSLLGREAVWVYKLDRGMIFSRVGTIAVRGN